MSETGRILLAAAVNFAAAFIQASTGFGYALVAVPLMALFLPMADCSAVSALTIVAIGLQMSLKLRKHLKLRIIAVPVLCCLSTINVGLYMLSRFDELLLRIILAGLLLVVTGISLFMRVRRISVPAKWYTAAAAGLVTGVATGMFNTVGPFLMLYYINVCEDTLELKASLEFSFLIAGIYSSLMHIFVYRNITGANAPMAALSAAAALAAGVLGLKLFRKINKEKITLLVYILLPVMAAMLILNGIKG